MKTGARTIGVAESYDGNRSTLAAAVVRADRTVDGLAFESCTVGGTDATDAVCSLVGELDREDFRAVLVSGIAPAWYNVLDLEAIAEAIDRPVLSVSFEASPGLEDALRREFSEAELEHRLATYRRQPRRTMVAVNDEKLFVRRLEIGRDEADELLRAFTPEGGRPEPLRIARLAARAADQFQTAAGSTEGCIQ